MFYKFEIFKTPSQKTTEKKSFPILIQTETPETVRKFFNKK